MKNTLLLLLLCLPMLINAQNGQSSKKKKKELKKERHEQLLKLIEGGNFAIVFHTAQVKNRPDGNLTSKLLTETPSIQNPTSRISLGPPTVLIDRTSNFIAQIDNEWTIQLATNYSKIDADGLGGWILDGEVTTFKMKDKGIGKGVDLRLNYLSFDSFDMFVNTNEDGYASLLLNGGPVDGLRLIGEILPLEESQIVLGDPTLR